MTFKRLFNGQVLDEDNFNGIIDKLKGLNLGHFTIDYSNNKITFDDGSTVTLTKDSNGRTTKVKISSIEMTNNTPFTTVDFKHYTNSQIDNFYGTFENAIVNDENGLQIPPEMIGYSGFTGTITFSETRPDKVVYVSGIKYEKSSTYTIDRDSNGNIIGGNAGLFESWLLAELGNGGGSSITKNSIETEELIIDYSVGKAIQAIRPKVAWSVGVYANVTLKPDRDWNKLNFDKVQFDQSDQTAFYHDNVDSRTLGWIDEEKKYRVPYDGVYRINCSVRFNNIPPGYHCKISLWKGASLYRVLAETTTSGNTNNFLLSGTCLARASRYQQLEIYYSIISDDGTYFDGDLYQESTFFEGELIYVTH
ncbi:hypothetical protein [Tuberibacillus calidus]|jgi:hypothetical protein|uniref:hypothetical protein n=1 Tax=Tuberibacillus calidus TaxID=340097 RepID=UPI0003F9E809|nr:hypothetical protein [Tuberibacillus calidus]